VFPNNLDRSQYPVRTRFWGIFNGTLVMAAAAATLVTPATLEVTLPICFAGFVGAALVRNSYRSLIPEFGAGALVATAFLAFAMLSALWAAHPYDTLGWGFISVVAFLGCGISARVLLSEQRRNIFHISEGLWIGIAAGLIYLAVEILTKQAIKIWLYNALHLGPGDLRPRHFFSWKAGQLVSIMPTDLTRNVAPVPLYIWATLLAIRGTTAETMVRATMCGVFTLAAVVVMISENETAKVAIAAGALLFVLARCWPLWSLRLLQVGWVTVCLAIVPISLSLYRMNLHNAPWLQPTAQHRIIIWNRVAEETMKSPLMGIGAGMTYWNFDGSTAPKEGELHRRYSRDAHSVFLQTWFELGVVGAALLSLIGLAVLQRIKRLGSAMGPYGYATFASAAVTLASSWGMWRVWFVYMFAFAVVIFAIAVRAGVRSERTPGLPHALG
jgi:O-Antigen ligase